MNSYNLISADHTEENDMFISNSQSIFFSISQISVETEDDFVKINLAESDSYTMAAGKPMLPVIVKTFVFPKGTIVTSVNCEIIEFGEDILAGKIAPASKPLPKLEINAKQAEDIATLDSIIYQSSEFYPDKWYDYTLTHGIDGVKLSIRFYPVRYKPLDDLIITASDIKIDISYNSLLKTQDFSEECDMVIIAPDGFSRLLEPLVMHKSDIGIVTFLKTTEEIYEEYAGRDEPEQIKYFIKDAIESYNISYVLLVGGMKGIKKEWYVPVRETNLDDGWESGYISDLYYADVYRINQTSFEKEFDDWDSNKNDVFAEWDLYSSLSKDLLDCDPDVHVGRLACRSRNEVKTVVDKIISYETKNQNFVHSKRMICVGGDTVPSESDSENICEGEFMCDIASDSMVGAGYDIVKLYASTGALKGPLSVIKKLTLGAGFVYFNGHGNPSSWSTHPPQSDDYTWINGLNVKQMNLLFNKNRLPIVVVAACHNSQFNVTPLNFVEGIKNYGLGYFSLNDSSLGGFWRGEWIRECWGWKFLSVKHGGAIATIGNTGLGYGMDGSEIAYSDWISLQFFDAIGNQNKTTVGEAHSKSISDYVATFGVNGENNKIDRKSVDDLVLLGDPSLKIGGYSE